MIRPGISTTNLLISIFRFLLARLYMDALSTGVNARHVKNILEGIPDGSSETPETKAYEHTIERIRAQPQVSRDLAFHSLGWLISAARPMMMPELQHALAIEPEDSCFDPDKICDEETLISVCAGLISLDGSTKRVQLSHYTAQEYIQPQLAVL